MTIRILIPGHEPIEVNIREHCYYHDECWMMGNEANSKICAAYCSYFKRIDIPDLTVKKE